MKDHYSIRTRQNKATQHSHVETQHITTYVCVIQAEKEAEDMNDPHLSSLGTQDSNTDSCFSFKVRQETVVA